MPDETLTQAQDKPPERTMPVAVDVVQATVAGDTKRATLARAHRPTVEGYELHEVVGKGGMGVVYRAKQLGLDRDIAIKFLRDEFHPRSATGLRFLEEARITAQLQHPGIPAVHEVGSLADGRPYLAMKLIRGRTLDALLKEQGSGAAKWLPIFESICQAVGFAHAHSVVHRDLKPSNVMVGAFGEVQVMDWGLAKVLGHESHLPPAIAEVSEPQADELHSSRAEGSIPSRADGSVETRAGSFLGTPAFMAPEQATGDVAHISPRTDVFGLGAVLCTLLTGQPPYLGTNSETTRLMAASIKQDEAIERLNKCGAEKDIIELCKQCLAPVPGDRPETGVAVAKQIAALRLASDERARKAEIDRAKTEVAAEAQRKRRRQQVFAAGAVAAVALIGAATAGLYWWSAEKAKVDAVEQRKIADDQRTIAEIKKKEAETTLSFFLNDLLAQAGADAQAEAMLSAGGEVKTDFNIRIKTLLDRAAAELSPEKIEARFPKQPFVQAKILAVVGKTYRGIGLHAPAIEFLKRAAAIYFEKEGPDAIDTIKAQSEVALAYQTSGKIGEAISMFQQIYDRNVARLEPDHGNTIRSLNNLALANRALGKVDDALKQFAQVRDVLERKMNAAAQAGDDKEAKLYRDGWMQARNNFANATLAAQKKAEAIELFKLVHMDRTRFLGPEHPDTLKTLNNLADAYRENNEFASAVITLEKVRDGQLKARGPEHPETLATINNLALTKFSAVSRLNPDVELKWKEKMQDVIDTFAKVCEASVRRNGPEHADTLDYQGNLAKAYAAFGNHGEAIRRLQVLLDTRKRVLGPEDDVTLSTQHYLAEENLADGQVEKAITLFQDLCKIIETKHGPDHGDSISAHLDLALAYGAAGKTNERIAEYELAAQRIEKNQFNHQSARDVIFNLDDTYTELKLYANSENWLRKWLGHIKSAERTDSLALAGVQARLGRALTNQNKWSDAVPILKECYEIRKQKLKGSHITYNTQSMFGGALHRANLKTEAESMLTDSFENLMQMKDQIPKKELYFLDNAAERLVNYYDETKRQEKADAVRKRMDTAKRPVKK